MVAPQWSCRSLSTRHVLVLSSGRTECVVVAVASTSTGAGRYAMKDIFAKRLAASPT
jgi:hypothetical protein